MTQKIIISALLLMVVSLIGPTSVQACKSHKVSRVTMMRTPCYGTCPWFSVTISEDGTIYYEGKKFVDNEGVYVAYLDEDEVESIFEYMKTIEVDSFYEKYDAGVTDLPGLNFQFQMKKGDTKEVKILSAGPEELISLGNQIDAIIEAAWRENKFEQGSSK